MLVRVTVYWVFHLKAMLRVIFHFLKPSRLQLPKIKTCECKYPPRWAMSRAWSGGLLGRARGALVVSIFKCYQLIRCSGLLQYSTSRRIILYNSQNISVQQFFRLRHIQNIFQGWQRQESRNGRLPSKPPQIMPGFTGSELRIWRVGELPVAFGAGMQR